MEFCLLGPVELWNCGERVELGPMKQRIVLAALLANAGHPVSPDALIYRVWGEKPPTQVRNVLHTYITRLRGVLARLDVGLDDHRPRLLRQPAGYLLDLDPADVDLLRFRSLVGQAKAAGSAESEGVHLLREAIDLWRGEPLAGCAGEWAALSRDAWRLEHRDAVVLWAQAMIQLGQGADAVAPVERLIDDFPLVEPVLEVLMRALHAAGRDPEALDRYEATRRLLADELGVDPGSALRRLHRAILRGEIPEAAATRAIVAQIPAGVAGFVGREAQMSQLDDMLIGARPGTAVISAVHGTAGVGKTALAVHWARRVADRFPDGQLYVELRGFAASESVTSPATALQGFLEALGVTPQRVPADLDSRAAMYRSLLADRRILLILDNARDAEQVRPLLPGSAHCLTLITSRNQLSGLVVAYGARPLSLDLLAEADARRLVVDRIGAERAASGRQALEEMISRCVGLPLALAVLASRIAMRPDVPLAAMAAELRETRSSLDAFASDDPATDARTVFSWSYRTLGTQAARLFRMLGLQFGEDIGVPAAASLMALDVSQVRTLIRELTTAQLIAECGPGRYTMHDLLRAYAGELAEAEESAADRRAAERRLLEHYLHTAYAAHLVSAPARHRLVLYPPVPGVRVESIADNDEAITWFTAEHRVLLAAIRRAVAVDLSAHAWRLGWIFSRFLLRRGYWQDHEDTVELSLAASRRLGDRFGEALIRHSSGVGQSRLGRADRARAELEEAVRIHGEIGDHAGQANAYNTLAVIVSRSGDQELALEHFERSAELHRQAGNAIGEATVLNGIAWTRCLMGRFETALPYGYRALSRLADFNDLGCLAATWDTIGYAQHHLGRLDEARTCYGRSLDFHRQTGDRFNQALVLTHLGEVLRDDGEPAAARSAWREALEIFVELDHADAAGVRRLLDNIDAGLRPATTTAEFSSG